MNYVRGENHFQIKISFLKFLKLTQSTWLPVEGCSNRQLLTLSFSSALLVFSQKIADDFPPTLAHHSSRGVFFTFH